MHDFDQTHCLLLHLDDEAIDQCPEVAPEDDAGDGDEDAETGVVQRNRNPLRQLLRIAAARRLRADNPELPVLIASGYSSVMVESGLSPEERIHFVSKPFEVTKLAETIREALAKRTTEPD